MAARSAKPRKRSQTRSKLPPGSRIEWVGEFGNLQDAIKRLSIVVPISLTLIAVLLSFNFGSMIDTLLAMSVIYIYHLLFRWIWIDFLVFLGVKLHSLALAGVVALSTILS